MDTLQQIQKGANIMAKGIAKPFGAHAPEGYIDHNDTDLVVCPNCGYELTSEEAEAAVLDFWVCPETNAEQTVTAICPECELDFALTAKRSIRYSTAKAGE